VSYFATDIAGNVEAARSHSVWVDQTAPTFTFAGSGQYTVDQAVNVTCVAADNLSGVATTNCTASLLAKQGWELALGSTTVQATAADVAGNPASATATVTISVT